MGTAIYTRVSTNEQVEQYGLDAQLTKCQAMTEVKDWEVTHEFCDEGISGTKDESHRPGLAALLEAIESGEVDSVIVASIDRLGRSTRLVLRMVDRLSDSGVDLVSCKESLDTSTASGRFVLRMFASLAELDRDNIVERTTDGRNARGRIDGEKGGRMPLGYERGEGEIIVIPDEAEIVRQIFAMRHDGHILQKIADTLNERGVTSKQGGKWYPSTVRTILSAEDKYRGGLRGYSPIYWPAILSD